MHDLCVYVSVCRYVCLATNLWLSSACLYICLFLCFYVCVYMSVSLSSSRVPRESQVKFSYLYIFLSNYQFIYLSHLLARTGRAQLVAYLSVSNMPLSICLSICMSVCVFVIFFIFFIFHLFLISH